MVERDRLDFDEHLAGLRLGVRSILVAQDLRPAVLVDPNCLHRGTMHSMTAAELSRAAQELGLDVIGAAPAEPYEDTERHIRDRWDRGLFADMRFSMARPDISCHPEKLLPGARTVVSAPKTARSCPSSSSGRSSVD